MKIVLMTLLIGTIAALPGIQRHLQNRKFPKRGASWRAKCVNALQCK